MKRFLSVVALACVLASSTLAGEIPSAGSPAPGPNGATTSTEPGEIPTSGAPTTSTEPGDIPSGGFSEEALSAFLSTISFLV